MKPAPFGYADPRSVEEALDVLVAEGEGAKVLAGGQSLLPLLSMRLAAPTALVDINRIPGLDRIDATHRTASGSAPSCGTRRCWPRPRPPACSRCWAGRPRMSPTQRSATGGRRSAPSRTPTRPAR